MNKPTYKISPSSLNLFLECQRCFWLQLVKKEIGPDTPFPNLPSGMDKQIIGSVVFFIFLFISLYLISTMAEVTEPEQNIVFHNTWSQIVRNANIVFILLLFIPASFGILIYFLES